MLVVDIVHSIMMVSCQKGLHASFFFFLDKNTDSGLHQPAVCIGAILYINTVLFVLCVQSLEGVLSATAVCDAIVSK